MPRRLSPAKAQQIEQLNAVNSPLLKIPAEIREKIFEYAVAEDEPIDIVDPSIGYSKYPSTLVTHPAIARASRQCRRETVPIFYSENTFQLRCTLKDKARQKLQTIFSRSQPGWLLRERTSDEQLTIFFNHSYAVMENLETTRLWLKTIGLANQRFLRRVVLCCAAEDAPVVLEMASMRWDTMYLSLEDALLATGAEALVEGWKFAGEKPASDGCHGAAMRHCEFVLES